MRLGMTASQLRQKDPAFTAKRPVESVPYRSQIAYKEANQSVIWDTASHQMMHPHSKDMGWTGQGRFMGIHSGPRKYWDSQSCDQNEGVHTNSKEARQEQASPSWHQAALGYLDKG